MLLWANKALQLTISFEQCSHAILEKAYSIAFRPKMIVVRYYEHPKYIPPKNDQERIFSINF